MLHRAFAPKYTPSPAGFETGWVAVVNPLISDSARQRDVQNKAFKACQHQLEEAKSAIIEPDDTAGLRKQAALISDLEHTLSTLKMNHGSIKSVAQTLRRRPANHQPPSSDQYAGTGSEDDSSDNEDNYEIFEALPKTAGGATTDPGGYSEFTNAGATVDRAVDLHPDGSAVLQDGTTLMYQMEALSVWVTDTKNETLSNRHDPECFWTPASMLAKQLVHKCYRNKSIVLGSAENSQLMGARLLGSKGNLVLVENSIGVHICDTTDWGWRQVFVAPTPYNLPTVDGAGFQELLWNSDSDSDTDTAYELASANFKEALYDRANKSAAYELAHKESGQREGMISNPVYEGASGDLKKASYDLASGTSNPAHELASDNSNEALYDDHASMAAAYERANKESGSLPAYELASDNSKKASYDLASGTAAYDFANQKSGSLPAYEGASDNSNEALYDHASGTAAYDFANQKSGSLPEYEFASGDSKTVYALASAINKGQAANSGTASR